MKEALFYKKLAKNQVKCILCNHNCIILENQRGICGVRKNSKGKLYSLVYDKVISQHVDPIEKKPLYNFLPGSKSFSIATVGCNFKCMHCQNADISQASKEDFFYDRSEIPGDKITAQQVVESAIKQKCQSISYTYTEPTVYYEFALDCMKLANQNNLKNVWVTNGYISIDALKNISSYLDAVNVDLKFFSEKNYKQICGAKLQPIIDNLKLFKKLNIWLEVTTLIIPKLNDSEEELSQIAKFINNNLGSETPWHVTAFYPTYKLLDTAPTSQKIILKALEIGKRTGLKYVYGGNISDDSVQTTFCPKCNEKVIERFSYQTIRHDKKGECPNCITKIDGVFI